MRSSTKTTTIHDEPTTQICCQELKMIIPSFCVTPSRICSSSARRNNTTNIWRCLKNRHESRMQVTQNGISHTNRTVAPLSPPNTKKIRLLGSAHTLTTTMSQWSTLINQLVQHHNRRHNPWSGTITQGQTRNTSRSAPLDYG
jgi:hypothetical protein